MRVLVTGGAGFVGANLVRALLDEPMVTAVHVIDDLSTGDRANLDGLDADLTVGSVNDADLLDRAAEGVDAIVHLAARPSVPRSVQDPVATHHANTTGTLNVLEAARRVGRPQVIMASSSSVYGANPTLPKSEDLCPAPMSPYAASKLAGESYALAYANCFDLPVLVFRFFNVFGPLQPAGHAYAAAIPTFLDAALRGEPIPVHGDGGQTRDFTYVGSLAAVVVEAVTGRISSQTPVNLAFGSRRSLLDVISDIGTALGREPEREHQPPRVGDVRHSQADQTRLRELFPQVKPTPFEEGLARTVEWFKTLPDYA